MLHDYIFNSQAQALAALALIDAGEGYPKDDVDYNGGIHVSNFEALHAIEIRQHPTQANKYVLRATNDIQTRYTAALSNGTIEEIAWPRNKPTL